ncbi:MAG: hypothetical protein DI630_35255 [Gordonia sp. (in: high G+C Gram-positive bacteria)]|nr:MAG: hypothetical protein DI630_35255 [Gordonia sp. (in: high G+C Gram-positive bacteria)]
MMTAAGDTRPADLPRLVASCWAAITYLANHPQMNDTATQDDVDAALQLPATTRTGAPTPPRRSGLAMCRGHSPSPPGSEAEGWRAGEFIPRRQSSEAYSRT